ncbi:DUF3263 domain-containing protein [Streptomyces kaniharaensis]|uniref:DUF3263 domain-containing protein n=1 Tax=Streptomyces kaniharaensis TaxID=212423 RepID=UPI002DDD596A|nr:DUF3263 domain-containing protein [Streptomyces kaniharaensis]
MADHPLSTPPDAIRPPAPPPNSPDSDRAGRAEGVPAARLALSEHDSALLDFEHRHWPRSTPAAPGPKEAAIRQELGISPTRYYQLLNGLMDSEAALARHPVMINRLRAVRESRRIARQ